VLYQNDDLGKDYLNGIKAGLGGKAASMIVTEASYEVSDPTIDSQILKIKDAGADLFFSATTPKQAAQAIKKVFEIGWHPVQILDIYATSVGAVMKPAGLEASKGVISVNYGKDPLDPTWKDDAGMKKYFEFMAKYYPDGNKDSSFNSYGHMTSQLMAYVLKQCRDDLTRENVMKQAASLKNVQLDLLLPGISATTTPTGGSARSSSVTASRFWRSISQAATSISQARLYIWSISQWMPMQPPSIALPNSARTGSVSALDDGTRCSPRRTIG
jgi:branched-chain amino acid transport system substrate-binding protein